MEAPLLSKSEHIRTSCNKNKALWMILIPLIALGVIVAITVPLVLHLGPKPQPVAPFVITSTDSTSSKDYILSTSIVSLTSGVFEGLLSTAESRKSWVSFLYTGQQRGISFPMPSSQSLYLQTISITRESYGVTTWKGELPGYPLTRSILSIDKEGTVDGYVEVHPLTYKISGPINRIILTEMENGLRPIPDRSDGESNSDDADGGEVVGGAEEDSAEDEGAATGSTRSGSTRSLRADKNNPHGLNTIRFMVLYGSKTCNRATVTNFNTIKATLKTSWNEMGYNQYELVMACVPFVNGSPSDYRKTLHNLYTSGSAAVQRERERLGADTVVAIGRLSGVCGIAPRPASTTKAAALVDSNCISKHTFEHEVGHNFGLFHNRYQKGGKYDCCKSSDFARCKTCDFGSFQDGAASIMSYQGKHLCSLNKFQTTSQPKVPRYTGFKWQGKVVGKQTGKDCAWAKPLINRSWNVVARWKSSSVCPHFTVDTAGTTCYSNAAKTIKISSPGDGKV